MKKILIGLLAIIVFIKSVSMMYNGIYYSNYANADQIFAVLELIGGGILFLIGILLVIRIV